MKLPAICPKQKNVRIWKKSESILAKLAGQEPVGYRGPLDVLPNCALKLMAEKGYLYCSTLKDCDWAYLHQEYPIVELPTEPTLDDFSYFYFSYADEATITCSYPVDYVYEIWKDNFDELANEGDKIMVLKLHPQTHRPFQPCKNARTFYCLYES